MQKRFNEFGLSEALMDAVAAMGFETPTPIQQGAIPLALRGGDLVGLAQTGTGKTAAFGIPLVERLEKGRQKSPAALILVPTRELAIQVTKELDAIGKKKGVVTTAVYGGQPIVTQLRALKKGVDVVVGTPGRIMDHMRRKTLILKDVGMVVLDEADEMLNMGFVEDMETILSEVPKPRQTLLFSATMPPQILRIAKRYMTEPETVRSEGGNLVVRKIEQFFYTVRPYDRSNALMRLLDVEDYTRFLVFCQTRKDVDDLSATLQNAGYDAAGLHGDYSQELRDETMKRYRQGDTDILVATDVAARGLDIPDVTHVVNFSLPQNTETYVHRIGRTGRAGKSGKAITLVGPRETRRIQMIERATKGLIRKAVLPTRAAVKKARQQGVADALDAAIEKGLHVAHDELVRELCARYSAETIASAAIALMAGDMEIPNIAAEPSPSRTRSARPADGNYVKLRLGVGRRDGIQVGDLVRSISVQSKIPGRELGKIDLFNRHSLVEVPSHMADRVAHSLNQGKVYGRKVQIM